MAVLLVVVGSAPAPTVPGAEIVVVPDQPDRAALDAVLDRLGGGRLGVVADDAGLAAVLVRLLRRDALAGTPVGLFGPGRARLGLGDDPVEALLAGVPRRVGLVRDDHGGVVVGGAELTAWAGGPFGVHSYVDEHELVRAEVRSFTVAPSDGELTAEVRGARRWGRARSLGGRAVTVSCAEARLVVDGVVLPRAQTRRSWWYEPDLWSVYESVRAPR